MWHWASAFPRERLCASAHGACGACRGPVQKRIRTSSARGALCEGRRSTPHSGVSGLGGRKSREKSARAGDGRAEQKQCCAGGEGVVGSSLTKGSSCLSVAASCFSMGVEPRCPSYRLPGGLSFVRKLFQRQGSLVMVGAGSVSPSLHASTLRRMLPTPPAASRCGELPWTCGRARHGPWLCFDGWRQPDDGLLILTHAHGREVAGAAGPLW